jgi:hypothetical protein
MGYSHYWIGNKPFSPEEWRRVKTATSTILNWCQKKGVEFHFEHNGPEPQVVQDECIVFNGRGDLQCETFVLAKQSSLKFACCKTNRLPYDLAIGLVLVAVAQIALNVLDICSDGKWDSDWREIREAYSEIFGLEPDCIFYGDDFELSRVLSGLGVVLEPRPAILATDTTSASLSESVGHSGALGEIVIVCNEDFWLAFVLLPSQSVLCCVFYNIRSRH